MKPFRERLLNSLMHSFRVKHTELPYMDSPWHNHSEYELILILKGSGKRIVGDCIDNFYPGDLVLVGPNLPHIWQNDEEYLDSINNLFAEVIVIQFNHDAFGEDFFNLPELQSISRILRLAKRGVFISGRTQSLIIDKMWDSVKSTGVKRLSLLLEILDILSQSKDLKVLTTTAFEKVYKDLGTDKLNKVFEYIALRFHEKISLDQISDTASMSKTAFCRYFKTKTGKTFQQYLNEFRVSYACKLLIEGDLSIKEISHKCGFASPTYFNRQFKAVKEENPREYLSKYQNIATKQSL